MEILAIIAVIVALVAAFVAFRAHQKHTTFKDEAQFDLQVLRSRVIDIESRLYKQAHSDKPDPSKP